MKEKEKLAKYIGNNIFQYRKKKKLTDKQQKSVIQLIKYMANN